MAEEALPFAAAEAGAEAVAPAIADTVLEGGVGPVLSGAEATGIAEGGLNAANALGTLKSIATVLSPIASLVQAAGGIASAKRAGNVAAAPVTLPTIAMPIANQSSDQQAFQNSMIAQQQRRGRASTILTQPADSDRLGG